METIIHLLRAPEETSRQRAGGVLSLFSTLRVERQPEAAAFDQEVDESQELFESLATDCNPAGTGVEHWGKLGTILARARAVASLRPRAARHFEESPPRRVQ